MFCGNCGASVEEGFNNCPNCGAPMKSSVTNQFDAGSTEFSSTNPFSSNTDFNNANYYQQPSNTSEVKTTSYLVFSILELFCVNFLTGLIGLILYFVKLKPSVERGDMEAVKSSKKSIKITLWIGVGLYVLGIIMMLLIGVPAILSGMNTLELDNSDFDTINSLNNNSPYIRYDDDYTIYRDSYDYDF